jgi:outer membrane protein TolC
MSKRHSLRLACALLLAGPGAAQGQQSSTGTEAVAGQPISIDLVTALQLAGANSLDIQIARERLNAASADATSAVFAFLPWLSAGAAYRAHGGLIQDVVGNIVTADKEASLVGGAINLQVDVGEALYHSLAAKQRRLAAEHGLVGQRQETLLRAAQGYFDLLMAQASVTIAEEALQISQEYEAQLQRAVDVGIALKGDELRVQVQSRRNQLALQQATEQRLVLAARLAESLRLDPTLLLVASDKELVPLPPVAPLEAVEALVAEALASRPEASQASALVQAAEETRKAAVYGPLIPTLAGQALFGDLRGGPDGVPTRSGASRDYAAAVSWRLGPGGILDVGRTRAATARLGESQSNLDKVKDAIAREVVEARTRLVSQREQMTTAREALTVAEDGLRLARARMEFGVGVVLENIVAEQDLTRSRLDYVHAIGEHDKAQYALERVLGRLGAAPSAPSSAGGTPGH